MVVEDGKNLPFYLFLKIGLDERTAKHTITNNKVTNNLVAVIHKAGVTEGCNRTVGNLLHTVSCYKFPANALMHRSKLLEYIVSLKIKTPAQLEAAFSFFASTVTENFEVKEFEEACGVGRLMYILHNSFESIVVFNVAPTLLHMILGVSVTAEDTERTVNEVFEENKASILEQRYQTNVGDLFEHVRKRQPWADPKIVKQLIDNKLYELLRERTEADDKKVSKKKKEKPVKVEDKAVVVDAPGAQPSEEELNLCLTFPQPEENFKVYKVPIFIFCKSNIILRVCNAKELLEKHLKATGARFIPASHLNQMAICISVMQRQCLLALAWRTREMVAVISGEILHDDTNPEAEKKEYIDHIEEIVDWMGWKPFKITNTSDYFQELYDLAVELIRRGHAYVDHQTPEEIKDYREKKMNSPWRDRPIAESLKLFDDMRRGLIEEGKATLRMKQDMQSDNFNMYYLIAYRIKASCLPLVSLFFSSLLLIHIQGASGVSTQAMIMLIALWILLKISHIRDCSLIRLDCQEYHIRGAKQNSLLNNGCSKSSQGEYILEVVPQEYILSMFLYPFFVFRLLSLTWKLARPWIWMQRNGLMLKMMMCLPFYKVAFSNVVHIEQSYFRLKDSKDYYGLAPGISVLLRYAFPIKCTDVILGDDKETVIEIRAEYDP
ncbi:Glutamyl/glutaminyl-tRNA synthetase, class Ib, catalytic domain [Dillenia turbinata]|uniref:glutamine--tRNA ligase n=1 Tax=Dillenia turbinata TaxID=194707 RepID=A0AAN8UYM2_9MAGN